jgi:hypothetical protein
MAHVTPAKPAMLFAKQTPIKTATPNTHPLTAKAVAPTPHHTKHQIIPVDKNKQYQQMIQCQEKAKKERHHNAQARPTPGPEGKAY